jgi:hypothetical protein
LDGNADIFVSSAEADRPWVELFVRALRAEGWSVYWDLDLPTGEGFEPPAETALDAAALIVVVWSRLAAGARGIGLAADRIDEGGSGLAVRRDDAALPDQLEYCPVVDMRRWEGGSLPERLRQEIGRRLEHVSAQAALGPARSRPVDASRPMALPSPPASARRGSPMWMAAMASFVLLLGGIGVASYLTLGTGIGRGPFVGDPLPYPSAPPSVDSWQPTARDIGTAQVALGLPPTGTLGPQGSSTREAIAEFQLGLLARGEDWDLTGRLDSATADLLAQLGPMPANLASGFERAFLTNKDPGAGNGRFSVVDRARLELLWRALGMPDAPPQGDAVWPALRRAISATRARLGLGVGQSHLDSRLWQFIRP